MTTTAETAPETHYLTFLRDVPNPPPGLSKLDTGHAPQCSRGYFSSGERTESFPRHPDELIGRGWAIGIDTDGVARVLLPARYRLRGFLGFALANHAESADRPRLSVITRGRAVLRVEGLTAQSVGQPVYAIAPNSFTLTPGEFLVGQVAHLEDAAAGLAAVDVKRFDDPEPFRDPRYS